MADTLTSAEIEFRVAVRYDEEAKVWWVSDCNVPGMHLEADDGWELVRRCAKAAPELTELNRDEMNAARTIDDAPDARPDVVEKVATILAPHLRMSVGPNPDCDDQARGHDYAMSVARQAIAALQPMREVGAMLVEHARKHIGRADDCGRLAQAVVAALAPKEEGNAC